MVGGTPRYPGWTRPWPRFYILEIYKSQNVRYNLKYKSHVFTIYYPNTPMLPFAWNLRPAHAEDQQAGEQHGAGFLDKRVPPPVGPGIAPVSGAATITRTI